MFSINNTGVAASCEELFNESRKLGQYTEEIQRCINVLSRMNGFEECLARLSEYVDALEQEKAQTDEAAYILDRVNMTYHQTDENVGNEVEMGDVHYPVYKLSEISGTGKNGTEDILRLIV